jgi:hypothetical protein
MNSNRHTFLFFLLALLPIQFWGGTIILKGKLNANIPFTMHLHNNGKSIEGAVHYANQRADEITSVRGTIRDNEEMTLSEYNGKSKIGTYKGVLRSSVYLGIYTSSNGKTFPFTSGVVDENNAIKELIDNQFETTALIFKKEQNNIHVELRVDYPINGNLDLVGDTRLYIRESIEKMFDINVSYSDLTDGQALINHVGEKKFSDLKKEKYGDNYHEDDVFEEIIEVNKSFENKNCVSFCASWYYCHGGVGNKFRIGATFRKEDGTQMLVINYPVSPQLEQIVKEAVKSELGDFYEFVNEKEFEESPMPRELPHLTKYGVQFDYQHYEIGAGILGQVSVVIPYEEIKQYMKDEARMLIE